MELPGTKTLSLVLMLDCNVMFSSNVSPCLKGKGGAGRRGVFEADRGEGVHTQGERKTKRGREDNRCRTGVCMQKC